MMSSRPSPLRSPVPSTWKVMPAVPIEVGADNRLPLELSSHSTSSPLSPRKENILGAVAVEVAGGDDMEGRRGRSDHLRDGDELIVGDLPQRDVAVVVPEQDVGLAVACEVVDA